MKKKVIQIKPNNIDRDKKEAIIQKKQIEIERLKENLMNKININEKKIESLAEERDKEIEKLSTKMDEGRYKLAIKKIELKYEEAIYDIKKRFRVEELKETIKQREEMLESFEYEITEKQLSYLVIFEDEIFSPQNYYSIFIKDNESLTNIHDLGWKSSIYENKVEIIVQDNNIPPLNITLGFEGIGDVRYDQMFVSNPVGKDLIIFYEDTFC